MLVLIAPPIGAAERPADLVLFDGAVYTVDTARSWASAVAVRDGRIVYVGDDDGARALAGVGTETIDLDGKMLLPGFVDSHVHPISGGLELLRCDLHDLASVEALLAKVRKCADARPNDPWIVGGGWDLPLFPDANLDRRLLDPIAAGRPVALAASDGHSLWVNSKALALAGINPVDPDPENVRIERDRETGEPSGTLCEDASRLVWDQIPRPSAAELAARLDGQVPPGLIAIDASDFSIVVATQIRSTVYGDLHGKTFRLPRDSASCPSREALDWHRSESGI